MDWLLIHAGIEVKPSLKGAPGRVYTDLLRLISYIHVDGWKTYVNPSEYIGIELMRLYILLPNGE